MIELSNALKFFCDKIFLKKKKIRFLEGHQSFIPKRSSNHATIEEMNQNSRKERDRKRKRKRKRRERNERRERRERREKERDRQRGEREEKTSMERVQIF